MLWRLATVACTMVATVVACEAARTVLSIEGTRFTINGRRTFLLGISYYGGLGARRQFVRQDLDDLQRLGFNWLRVWATWAYGGDDVSAVTPDGKPQEHYLRRLEWFIAECDRRGMLVDVTLTRGEGLGCIADMRAHEEAVKLLVNALRSYRNWYLDMANECNVGDDRRVTVEQLEQLRAFVRRLDPRRLVTASFAGDMTEKDVREALLVVGIDFLCPHRPRHGDSPAETAEKTRKLLDIMRRLGRLVPVHYQEPFRRGYGDWQPQAADFLADLRGAVEGGAAGWCLHNGAERDNPDGQPHRCFSLRTKRLFDQLDPEELTVASRAAFVLD
ncbi:MAG: hypothetical protein N2512_11670 [Armatimonadetes bacterium]|nr:hypothetical protein [Armatimonadota bacterium]